MALPTVETKKEESVVTDVQATKEDTVEPQLAPEPVTAETKLETSEGAVIQESGEVESIDVEVPVAPDTQARLPVTPEQKALSVVKGTGVNPLQTLSDMGIEDIKLDFTSFPKITLEKGNFSSSEYQNFGTEFEFIYMSKHPTYLFSSVPPDRDTESELVYSDDGQHDTSTGKHKKDLEAEWKDKGWGFRETKYDIVIGMCTTGPHADEFVQLQISPTSQGALGGYLYGLAVRGEDPRQTVARISAGPLMGQGQRAYTPWVIKKKK